MQSFYAGAEWQGRKGVLLQKDCIQRVTIDLHSASLAIYWCLVIHAGESKVDRCDASDISPLCDIGCRNWCALTVLAGWAIRLRQTIDLNCFIYRCNKYI